MHLAPREGPLAARRATLESLGISCVIASILALGLAGASGCIPPELGAGTGAGTGTGTGGDAGAGVSGGDPGGAGGGTSGLCAEDECAAAGGGCKNGACLFACGEMGACSTKIYCPASMPCRVECDGEKSCSGGVDCTLATGCEILCNALNSCGKAPDVATVDCPLGEANCHVWCESNACTTLIVKAGVSGADVVCEGMSACPDLSCQGFCNVTCGADSACAKVACTGGPCALTCGAPGACGEVICGGGACQVDCTGPNACATVTCDTACACDVTCGGTACANEAICPKDMSGLGPCSSMKGCTSAVDSCSTCP